jgi:hypothetical protein
MIRQIDSGMAHYASIYRRRGVIGDVRQTLASRNATVRDEAVSGLIFAGRKTDVPEMIRLLRDPKPKVARSARRVLIGLTGQDFGRNAGKWHAFYEAKKDQHRIEWLIDGLSHPNPRVRAIANSELERISRWPIAGEPGPTKQQHYREWWPAARGYFE